MKKLIDFLNEGLGRGREDDEYHTPDPVTRTHKIAFDVSKDGGEKHNRTVTISNSTKSKEEAHATAKAHLQKQGYKIHEASDICAVCGQTPCNCTTLDEAGNKPLEPHVGMGDSRTPRELKTQMTGATDDFVKSAAKKKLGMFHSKVAHMQNKLAKSELRKRTNEEVEQIDEAPKDHTIEAHGIKGMKGTPWRKTFKHEDHLNDWAEKNDSVEVHGIRELEGSKKHVKEEVGGDETGPTIDEKCVTCGKNPCWCDDSHGFVSEAKLTAAMKLQQAFQREQEKTARERELGKKLLQKTTPAPKKVDEAVVQFGKKKAEAPREINKDDVENAWALKHIAKKDDKISYQHNGVTIHHGNGDHTFILGGHKPLFDRDPKGKLKFKDDIGAARRAFKMPTQKANKSNVVSLKKEETESVEEGLKPEHNMKPGWMLKADPKLAKKVEDNKKKFKEFKKLVGTKKD